MGFSSPLIFDIGAIIVCILVVALVYYFRPGASDMRWLTRHGKRTSAIIVKIDQLLAGSRGDLTYRYRVYAIWKNKQTGKTHTVESALVPGAYLKSDGNPSLSRDIVAGESVEVLVDPSNPERAMIAGLPPKTDEENTYIA